MRNSIISTFLTLLAILAVSCSNEESVDTQRVGFIQFTFSSVPADSTVTLTLASADGAYSHTWPDASKFSPIELFFAGEYKAEAYAGVPGSEGFDCPFYYGSTQFEVMHMKQTQVNIDCRLMQAMVEVETRQAAGAAYSLGGVTIHTSGHAYITISPDEKRPAYVMPGETEVYLHVTDAASRSINLVTGFSVSTLSSQSYNIEIEEESDGVITLRCGNESKTIEINTDIFDSPAPAITSSGFSQDTTLHIIEGYPSAEPIKMHVESSAPLSALRLTIDGFDTKATDYHIDIDLMSEADRLKGMIFDMPTDLSADIDFTGLLETYQIDRSVNVTFTLQAIDILGRMSEPLALNVAIESVDFTLIYKSGAEIGVDKASIKLLLNVSQVQAHDFTLTTDSGTPLEITSTDWDTAARELTLNFNVPPGTATVPVKVYFLGVEKLRIDIERSSPTFDIVVDAFAKRARITVKGENQEIIEMVTRNARVNVNNKAVAVTMRDPVNGLLEISGLEPATRYDLSLWVIEKEFTATATFVTEQAQQIASADFEDVEEIFKYKHLPSGGEYSATRFAIYNQQNFSDVSVYWPKKNWASINNKTLCRNASHHNTWYMQPSAAIDFTQSASGSKSIMIRSVGWSLHGEPIPPSVQPNNDFVPYNTNRPSDINISAGRLFLGSYSFDPSSMSETYVEGLAFASRPSSLDGFFKYLPDVTEVGDNGKIVVELLNDSGSDTILVGRGEYLFATAPDFRSFNVPINYYIYNTPVTRIKIMIMSSVPASSGPSGDTGVPVTANLETASFVGSTLWIDDISFSY